MFPLTEIKVFFQQFKNFGDEYGPYVRRLGFQYSNIFRWNRQRSFLDIGLTFERFDESEALKEDIEQIGLNFAFPSQSIYIEKN